MIYLSDYSLGRRRIRSEDAKTESKAQMRNSESNAKVPPISKNSLHNPSWNPVFSPLWLDSSLPKLFPNLHWHLDFYYKYLPHKLNWPNTEHNQWHLRSPLETEDWQWFPHPSWNFSWANWAWQCVHLELRCRIILVDSDDACWIVVGTKVGRRLRWNHRWKRRSRRIWWPKTGWRWKGLLRRVAWRLQGGRGHCLRSRMGRSRLGTELWSPTIVLRSSFLCINILNWLNYLHGSVQYLRAN